MRAATWYHGVLRDLLAADGDPAPSVTASLLVALSDGLLEIAYLDDPESVPALVREAVARLLRSPLICRSTNYPMKTKPFQSVNLKRCFSAKS